MARHVADKTMRHSSAPFREAAPQNPAEKRMVLVQLLAATPQSMKSAAQPRNFCKAAARRPQPLQWSRRWPTQRRLGGSKTSSAQEIGRE
jgi:hypothetical protein